MFKCSPKIRHSARGCQPQSGNHLTRLRQQLGNYLDGAVQRPVHRAAVRDLHQAFFLGVVQVAGQAQLPPENIDFGAGFLAVLRVGGVALVVGGMHLHVLQVASPADTNW